MHAEQAASSASRSGFPTSLLGRTRCSALSNRPTLLVVDDEPQVGRMISHIAEECGYRARLTISAAAFRTEYETSPPAVILLDLSLPGGDGIELLRFLAERGSLSIIFIVSGFDQRVLAAACRLGDALGLKMGGTLTKPLLVGDFELALRRAVERFGTFEGGSHDGERVLGA